MSCERIEDLLVAFADGELAPAERVTVEAHLAACPGCRGLLDALASAAPAFASFPEVEPGPELRRRLLAIPSRRPAVRRVFDALLRPSLQPFYAAATILLVLASLVLLSPDRSSLERSVSKGVHRGYSRIERLYSQAGSAAGEVVGFAESVLGSLEKINPFKGGGD